MKNISWCPCLKVRVNFLPRRNYAAHFTVTRLQLIYLYLGLSETRQMHLLVEKVNHLLLRETKRNVSNIDPPGLASDG